MHSSANLAGCHSSRNVPGRDTAAAGGDKTSPSPLPRGTVSFLSLHVSLAGMMETRSTSHPSSYRRRLPAGEHPHSRSSLPGAASPLPGLRGGSFCQRLPVVPCPPPLTRPHVPFGAGGVEGVNPTARALPTPCRNTGKGSSGGTTPLGATCWPSAVALVPHRAGPEQEEGFGSLDRGPQPFLTSRGISERWCGLQPPLPAVSAGWQPERTGSCRPTVVGRESGARADCIGPLIV